MNTSEFMATRKRHPKVTVSDKGSMDTRPTTHGTNISKNLKGLRTDPYKNQDSNVSLPEIGRSGNKKDNLISEFKENINLSNQSLRKSVERPIMDVIP